MPEKQAAAQGGQWRWPAWPAQSRAPCLGNSSISRHLCTAGVTEMLPKAFLDDTYQMQQLNPPYLKTEMQHFDVSCHCLLHVSFFTSWAQPRWHLGGKGCKQHISWCSAKPTLRAGWDDQASDSISSQAEQLLALFPCWNPSLVNAGGRCPSERSCLCPGWSPRRAVTRLCWSFSPCTLTLQCPQWPMALVSRFQMHPLFPYTVLCLLLREHRCTHCCVWRPATHNPCWTSCHWPSPSAMSSIKCPHLLMGPISMHCIDIQLLYKQPRWYLPKLENSNLLPSHEKPVAKFMVCSIRSSVHL